MFIKIIIIGFGGFLGTISRFLLQKVIQEQATSSFPWGTLIVNILGSFIIGVVFALSVRHNYLSPVWRNFLAIGFCGGFTTFSSFSLDNYQLLAHNQILFTILYTATSVISGLLFLYSGILAVRFFS
ncbi:MAG TPA: fluoride efflux transporter CrcB [Salinivirga sp.]|uniref:fluoride efflux transporter CrcB n=1 Tax=Salinivirga sp. TaxID=1970192 RepID=UPI002B45DFFF|nr:fluoride efflux transporter CrcB [Salinivirga sp.]HKK58044.1 fluoride efflux transporter CrcB [Salinivirga sp.]